MGEMLRVELTKDEAETLVQLLDVAVKAGGLQTARAACALTDKVVAAAKANDSGDAAEITELNDE